MKHLSPGLLAGLAAAALWLLSGVLYIAFANDRLLSRLAGVFGIGPLQARFLGWPVVWSVVALLLTAAVITTVTMLLADRYAPRGNAYLVTWMSVVLAGAATGIAMDAASVVDVVQLAGIRGLASATFESTMQAAFWSLVIGWIPAFAARRHRAPIARRDALRLGAVALAMLLLTAAAVLGNDAWQAQIARDDAALQGWTDDTGAFIDPRAEGDPVPLTAPGVAAPDLDPDWCTPDRATLLLGGADAATGHRMQTFTLMNFSEEPCVIEGYADIAFEDQNGHLLDVDVAHGSGFMADDPGPALITVPAQGQAVTTITWDANATDGALVARTLYAAALPGMERGSWPVVLDINRGSSVKITAWAPFTGAAGVD
ncbi:DUF4232 domain-containing protein [Microbacterium sp.]|uniref:DUF4232 domain-containing protein n=1 Tax=Microbacterium sp. TaxID=51671 RepID=UPI0039E5E896